MSQKPKLLVLMLLLGLPFVAMDPLYGQNGGVEGRVIIEPTGEGVEGAQVRLIEATSGTVTSSGGSFSIQGIPPGAYTLEVRLFGYGKRSCRADPYPGSGWNWRSADRGTRADLDVGSAEPDDRPLHAGPDRSRRPAPAPRLASVRYTRLEQTSTDELWGEDEDRFDEDELTPRVGALNQVLPNVSVYRSYSRSFVPYYGMDREGDPFRPVRGEQYEAGLKSSLFAERLSATLALYRLNRSNVVSFVFDSEFGFHGVQGAEHRTYGIELVQGTLAPGWTVIGSYAHLDGRIVEDPNHEAGRRLSGSPPHAGSLWTSYEPGDRLGVGGGIFFTGKRRTLNSSEVVTPGHTTVDLAVSYRLADRYQARLNLKNALNRRYYTGAQSYTLVFPGPPRTVQLSLAATF